MASGLDKIRHVVVAMMENRSLDNLLGYLPDAPLPPGLPAWPARFLPKGGPAAFDGLAGKSRSNTFHGRAVFASRGATAWPSHPGPFGRCGEAPFDSPFTVPNPDPHEVFRHVTRQIFGTRHPREGQIPDMSGFLADYHGANPGAADQILQSYAPSQAPVIHRLAQAFAVCDRWFASVPTQTLPNRAFLHCGSSGGHLDNDVLRVLGFGLDIRTIFNVLEDRGHSWGVYTDSALFASVHLQFRPQLGRYDSKIGSLDEFQERCAAPASAKPGRKLPRYSFLEPTLVGEDEDDYHPPTDIRRGEAFLRRLYDGVRACPYRDDVLLVLLFDEHGGTYDHVPPPWGAAPPDPCPVGKGGFRFDRFGVRVPAVVVSSHVVPGTVFRADESGGRPPYDHTSVLATLRDWLRLDGPGFLPSPRVARAPSLAPVLAGRPSRALWPKLPPPRAPEPSPRAPLNGLQKGLLLGSRMEYLRRGNWKEAWRAGRRKRG